MVMQRITGSPWRRAAALAIAAPLVVALAVLAFAWPAARVQPRDLPVGVVATGDSGQRVVAALSAAEPGAFELRLYADAGSARTAIEDRDVYGAFVVSPSGISVLSASAAGPTVSQLLVQTGARLAGRRTVSSEDVVPLAPDDPRGTVLSSALLPLTICGVLLAAAVGVVAGLRTASRQLVALLAASCTAGAAAYLIAQPFLGALPHNGLVNWAVLSLMMLSTSAAAAGAVALVGTPGLGLAAAVMVFLGNPFSGVTSAPELLPSAVGRIGQWLPPGAGAELLRSTAYFDGSGSAGHLAVLIGWAVVGAGALVLGHHGPIRFAAGRRDAVVAAHAEAGDRLPSRIGGGEPAWQSH